jgi:hypothetical protein
VCVCGGAVSLAPPHLKTLDSELCFQYGAIVADILEFVLKFEKGVVEARPGLLSAARGGCSSVPLAHYRG